VAAFYANIGRLSTRRSFSFFCWVLFLPARGEGRRGARAPQAICSRCRLHRLINDPYQERESGVPGVGKERGIFCPNVAPWVFIPATRNNRYAAKRRLGN